MQKDEQAMTLIVYAGNAKSKAMEGVAAARKGEFDKAEQLLKESDSAMTQAHKMQTSILQDSFDDPAPGVSMLMAHAQDHMMNAITTLDLAREFIGLYQLLQQK